MPEKPIVQGNVFEDSQNLGVQPGTLIAEQSPNRNLVNKQLRKRIYTKTDWGPNKIPTRFLQSKYLIIVYIGDLESMKGCCMHIQK